MVDRAAIFADVTRRDALRREARLAPLNVPAEHHRAVALAIEAELRALAWGGRYAIATRPRAGRTEFLRGVHGIEAARARHPVG